MENTNDKQAAGVVSIANDRDFIEKLNAYHGGKGGEYRALIYAANRHVAARAEEARREAAGDMLDMLGRLHPYEQPSHGEEFKRRAYERLRRAMDRQQPLPVPDQAAIVWRGDLIAMWGDLVHKQSVWEDWKRMQETDAQRTAGGDAVAWALQRTDKPNEYGPSLFATRDSAVENLAKQGPGCVPCKVVGLVPTASAAVPGAWKFVNNTLKGDIIWTEDADEARELAALRWYGKDGEDAGPFYSMTAYGAAQPVEEAAAQADDEPVDLQAAFEEWLNRDGGSSMYEAFCGGLEFAALQKTQQNNTKSS